MRVTTMLPLLDELSVVVHKPSLNCLVGRSSATATVTDLPRFGGLTRITRLPSSRLLTLSRTSRSRFFRDREMGLSADVLLPRFSLTVELWGGAELGPCTTFE